MLRQLEGSVAVWAAQPGGGMKECVSASVKIRRRRGEVVPDTLEGGGMNHYMY
jgi:hypothetical protein